MSQEVLTKFIHLVFSDARLQEQRREITDRNDFIERVVRLGKEFDLEFTANDVSNALQMGRRAWLERGIG
jgi:hypothetical protein